MGGNQCSTDLQFTNVYRVYNVYIKLSKQIALFSP